MGTNDLECRATGIHAFFRNNLGGFSERPAEVEGFSVAPILASQAFKVLRLATLDSVSSSSKGCFMAKKLKPDPEREERITTEIIVDAYGAQERAMSWYYYLQDQLQFPFTAICTAKRAISPLGVKDEVEVIGMPDEDECEHEMFVTVCWAREGLAVPLAQLNPISKTDEQTKQAVADWHYWVQMSYEF